MAAICIAYAAIAVMVALFTGFEWYDRRGYLYGSPERQKWAMLFFASPFWIVIAIILTTRFLIGIFQSAIGKEED
jgi:hypothetical protein